jgi:hypothetical protein
MNALLQRYLDGELTGAESDELLARLSADPDLAAELRAHELALAAWKDVDTTVTDGFTDRVMANIAAAEDAPSRANAGDAGGIVEWRSARTEHSAPARSRWALAAALVLVFLAGHVTSRLLGGGPDGRATGANRNLSVAAASDGTTTTAPGLRYVRLVYAPDVNRAETVTVVGDFNDWDPDATPLRRVNGIWSTMLALPPGTYEYMFVVDGGRWETDPLALRTRDDGFGGRNAVLDVTS